ncbi:MAG: Glycine hydroxymethyltransferase [Candidatus Parvarchaeum acidiphilum ARMAN-4]|uniref:Glycine hydroxymethyltransferase n=1 Tax=Candidatus Parvarchaeum acidiphilum ARMAN-4 TaxID=662760 RepID=D2EGT0_PARA4|nr:MAG: Glycine hydroxymethyltransferase [Candidatus Parvarchaeum acidiphilum ARMAN-4]
MASIVEMVDNYGRYRRDVLNLQASENFLCSHVKMALGTDLGGRYSHVMPDGRNAYGGTEMIENIFNETERNIKTLYGSKFAEIRPLGGHIAAEISLLSTIQKNDTIMAISEENGGYTGYMENYLPNMLGFKTEFIPYSEEKQEIDYDSFEKKATEIKPKAVVLGQSFFVKHYDLGRIREICDKTGSKLLYDGSHVMGLVAGKKFQPDALKYSDILFGSTHKTFFGPQGGIVLTNNEELAEKINENVVWKTMDNYHPNRIAALGIAAQDLITFGESYAGWIVSNTYTLARTLNDSGIAVKYAPWYSESHQIILSKDNFQKYGDFKTISKRLENNRIIADTEGRLGTAEITRIGLTDMVTWEEVVSDALTGQRCQQRDH